MNIRDRFYWCVGWVCEVGQKMSWAGYYVLWLLNPFDVVNAMLISAIICTLINRL